MEGLRDSFHPPNMYLLGLNRFVSPQIPFMGTHTAPERCQPEKFATPSFSAFLVVCDQDKKLQVGQQIL